MASGQTNPATGAFAITKSDASNLSHVTRGIYVGGAGDLKVDMADGTTGITFTALAAGMVHPLAVKKVYSTGTTATGIVGLY